MEFLGVPIRLTQTITSDSTIPPMARDPSNLPFDPKDARIRELERRLTVVERRLDRHDKPRVPSGSPKCQRASRARITPQTLPFFTCAHGRYLREPCTVPGCESMLDVKEIKSESTPNVNEISEKTKSPFVDIPIEIIEKTPTDMFYSYKTPDNSGQTRFVLRKLRPDPPAGL
jgi:hypothetical protein